MNGGRRQARAFRFQRLTCDLAEARGIDPDLIRRDEEPWDRARKSYG